LPADTNKGTVADLGATFDWCCGVFCMGMLLWPENWVRAVAMIGTVCFVICFVNDISKEVPDGEN